MDTKPLIQRGWSKVLVKRTEEVNSAVTVLHQLREEKVGQVLQLLGSISNASLLDVTGTDCIMRL